MGVSRRQARSEWELGWKGKEVGGLGGPRCQTEAFRLIFLGDGKLLKAFELRVDMWGTFPG